MKRRAFLRRLATAALGLTLARTLPGIAAPIARLAEPPQVLEDAATGISVRFIRRFDVAAASAVNRFDVFMVLPDMTIPNDVVMQVVS